MALVLNELYAAPAQVPFDVQPVEAKRKLQGRFLHITDMHPDPYYLPGASEKSACHRKKPKKDKTRASYYGTPFSGCDSPFTLTNFTLDYLDKKWTSDIDFVIWTGDNARHDNDRKLPRTPDEIYHLNRVMANKMQEVFLSKGIPVVPSLGNNDVWPHNILMPGPNSITHEYSSIWQAFIPFPSLQVFQRGAYYSVEVIPDQLAVVSLNTMYFYDSNKAVGGCEFKERDDPGNLQLDWLEVQLEMYRQRGIKLWLSGHVPPTPGNYFPECYVRYAEMSLRYQDTILGHIFGHMNADHFTLIEARDLNIPLENAQGSANGTDAVGPYKKKKRDQLYQELLQDFSDLPKEKKIDHDEYAVVNISPSVVPNPYLPSFRIFAYNITGAPKKYSKTSRRKGHGHGPTLDKKHACKEGSAYQETWWCQLDKPWHSDADAPSRMNTLWTPLGYAQYNIRKKRLNASGKTRKPKYKLEYTTFAVDALHPPADPAAATKFKYAIPLRHLPRSLRNRTITESKFAPYQMRDLTIPSWVELAQRLARPKKEAELRKRFKKYMYQGGREG
ncbi:Endopolyphosphatase [Neolentinus lepideus HHB14362 ss-1]|uniref:Endopolyphosphatase n=1 Tax=Neolentinus lepideus HHB14362 ss-1 TaxID=1314782 RepID=A0A165S066_9AGAM|nr:Endopolyphosphatase [Neolentinus lepideus HHB14362 ss-1]